MKTSLTRGAALLFGMLFLAGLAAPGQSADAINVTGTIQEKDAFQQMVLPINLAFLLPPGAPAQALFNCLFSGGKNNLTDNCQQEMRDVVSLETPVLINRTGPTSVNFAASRGVSPGNYFLIMFGRKTGVRPITNLPYDEYDYGVQLLSVSPAQSTFQVPYVNWGAYYVSCPPEQRGVSCSS